MILAQMLQHDRISIQCHDNPDADTIASGFALYRYLESVGKTPFLFYSGKEKATKPNIVKMVELFDIPLAYLPEHTAFKGLLALVDCQYGEKNVTSPPADAICVIDHHLQTTPPTPLYDVRPHLASCSTLVWSLLNETGFVPDRQIQTALNYGLYMDSKGFEELGHPLDRDLRDVINLDEDALRVLKHSNLSLDDLQLVASSLNSFFYFPDGRYLLVEAPPCDPNILGFLSDLAMQVDQVDYVVAYSKAPDNIKFSVRSITRDGKASDIAEYISSEMGSGGGHTGKAGGRLSWKKLKERHGDTPIHEVISEKLSGFLSGYALIDCTCLDKEKSCYRARQKSSYADFSDCQEYEKQPELLAFVNCSNFFEPGEKLHIRMLEGDISVKVGETTLLMIGAQGEVYPIERAVFEKRYTVINEPADLNLPYPPVVLNVDKGERIFLPALAKRCLAKAGITVYATPLEKGVKMFTTWDPHRYVKGNRGDWLVISKENPDDWYLVKKERFEKIYKRFHTTC